MMPAYRRNSEFLYTWKNSSLYDDCLTNTIVIWKNSGIVSLVHWATHTGETASFFRMRVSAKSPDRMKRKKPNCLNLREHSGMLLSLVLSLWPERLHKLTKIYFPPAFPRPLRDHGIHLPMLVVDSCMLNVCKSVVWPCRVAEWCGKFANILPAL